MRQIVPVTLSVFLEELMTMKLMTHLLFPRCQSRELHAVFHSEKECLFSGACEVAKHAFLWTEKHKGV